MVMMHSILFFFGCVINSAYGGLRRQAIFRAISLYNMAKNEGHARAGSGNEIVKNGKNMSYVNREACVKQNKYFDLPLYVPFFPRVSIGFWHLTPMTVF